ncbi:hypothetical protein Nepgr_004836 [Nepenthes gracilis]|uniref:Uncharacterized protein n=1 Tax=Nepenthes gracilis TaxID=150966 RepID=A0AAD3XFT8_NEPGR|nr:hypothetical protein Nepgr_004836 [Nepenthes gracilis]
MSDLCMYELEDIVWNEFGQSDDHIVPHAVKEHWGGCAVESYNLKRTRCGVTGVASNAESIMLEEGSWSQSSDGDFIASYDDDSNKMALSSASDDNRNIRHCLKSSHVEPIGNELCADDPILGEQDAPMDNTLYHYPPHHVTSTENFFNSDIQDKENSDLFYGWPDIENFEDVDRMFRSCDSTFGLGIDDEQDFGLFSYSHDIEGSNDELKSSFKFSGSDSNVFSSVTKPGEELNNTAPFVGDNDKKLTPSSWKTSSPSLDAEGPSAGVHTTFLQNPKQFLILIGVKRSTCMKVGQSIRSHL